MYKVTTAMYVDGREPMHRTILLTAVLAFGEATACGGDDPDCDPGTVEGCTCPAGRAGNRLCRGGTWGACENCVQPGEGEGEGSAEGEGEGSAEGEGEGPAEGEGEGAAEGEGEGPRPVCEPGSGQPCFCDGAAAAGTETCVPDGSGWGACEGCPCVDHYACPAGEVCVAGACDGMFNRPYVLVIESAEIAEETEAGEHWDAMGGAPDPYAVVYVDDAEVARTAVVQDDRLPVWNHEAEITLFQSSALEIHVYDDDLTDPDWIGGIVYDLETTIKARESTGGAGSVQLLGLTMTIEPK